MNAVQALTKNVVNYRRQGGCCNQALSQLCAICSPEMGINEWNRDLSVLRSTGCGYPEVQATIEVLFGLQN